MSKRLAPATIALALTALLLPSDGLAQFGGPPPRVAAGHGVEIPGYRARLDEAGQIDQPLMFESADEGIHAMTGPTAIFWDPFQDWAGDYEVTATFTLNKPASHQVAYGLFIGGTDLLDDSQGYTYFVIRQDGQYLLKQRDGSSTSNVAGNWAPHAAVQAIDGSQTNQLTIRVAGGTVTFLANGQEILSRPASSLDTEGMVGLRIGHGLDLAIEGFEVEELQ